MIFSTVYPPATRRDKSRANVVGLQEIATTRDTVVFANSRTCCSAPARGGSKTTLSKHSSSFTERGCRKRSRFSQVTVFKPVAKRAAVFRFLNASSLFSTA